MNREIKFRGKSSVTNEWVYGSLVNVGNESHIVGFDEVDLDGHHLSYCSDRPVFTKQGTIGQFTGLHDKNGNEIYEGDIVQMNIERGDILCVVTWNLEVGEWDLNLVGCMIEGVRPLGLWLRDSSCMIKVIGNKFDNPELLVDKQ